MPTSEQFTHEVLKLLPVSGEAVSYKALLDQLNAAGYGGAAHLLRSMKQRGEIAMTVRITESGPVHEGRRA